MNIRAVQIPVALAAIVALAGCVSRVELEVLSEKEFEKMRTQIPISTSTAQISYVKCVTRKIIDQLDPPYDSFDWDVEIFDDEAINAFAMPGGKIGVFTGIFRVAKNQNQLAAVLGHEIAHVTEEHSLERANTQALGGTAIDLTGAVFGQNIGTAVGLGAQLGLFLPFGRRDESEADIVGLKFMAGAGFDPRQSVELWKNMEQENSAGPPEFLSTHPSADTRISDLIAELPPALALYNEAQAEGKRPVCQR